jgi:2'-hydroxyisoflavone reductase
MHCLVIGGTRFLGRHIVRQALDAGHAVTLLHRGRSGPGLFPEAEHRIADRNGDLAALAQGRWDVVIDTSAYVPRQVRTLAQCLAGRVERYLLVSTISVYAGFGAAGMDEDAPLQVLADPATETVDGSSYGGLKALCEQALAAALPGQALVARPGLIVGPHDPSGRFTWWLQRLARGGDVLAPGTPDDPVQCIDARDLAAWLLLQAERGTTGTFNLTGPATPLTMGALLQTLRSTLRPDARLHWVGEALLLAQGVSPWTELPLWVPRSDAGLHAVDIRRALASGLRCRPLAETAADTAAWAAAHDGPHAGIGLAPEREAALLAAWAQQHGSTTARPALEGGQA